MVDVTKSLSLELKVAMVDLLGIETIDCYVTPESQEATTILKGSLTQVTEFTRVLQCLGVRTHSASLGVSRPTQRVYSFWCGTG